MNARCVSSFLEWRAAFLKTASKMEAFTLFTHSNNRLTALCGCNLLRPHGIVRRVSPCGFLYYKHENPTIK